MMVRTVILYALVLVTMGRAGASAASLADIDTIVVAFEENHSFDNLFGLLPGADNLTKASVTAKTPSRA